MAERRGAIGVIIYSDPRDTTPVPDQVFPNGRWLPQDGVQRGSIRSTKPQGDPLTGGYPAKGKY